MISKSPNVIVEEDYFTGSYKSRVSLHRNIIFDNRLRDNVKMTYLVLVYLASTYAKKITIRLLAKIRGRTDIKINHDLEKLHMTGYLSYDRVGQSFKIHKIPNIIDVPQVIELWRI